MSGSGLPEYLAKFLAAENKLLMDNTEDSEREMILAYYTKTIVTPEDLQRKYSSDEVRELCLRTKAYVDMTYLNCVWDAKERLNEKNRLHNRSERFINAMLVKSVVRKMVTPYTDEDVANANLVTRSQLKRTNNIRLDRWKRQRERLALTAINNCSQSLSDDERPTSLSDDERPTSLSDVELPSSLSDDDRPTSPFEMETSPWQSETESSFFARPATPPNDSSDSSIKSNPELIMPKIEPDDSMISRANDDWEQAAIQINSESMSLLDTQSQSQPMAPSSEDYLDFGTQVAAASTQDADL